MFQKHKEEFEYLLSGQIDRLTSVLARSELKTLTLEEYKSQLCMFLYKYYQNQYLLVINDFQKKANISKEFKIIEQRLKSGNPIKFFNLRNQ
ncbi:MAG TPA: hypothetical protein CFH82_03755 [Sulfurospirillum sp. UBA12182]|nr:MAG TPA: hypothetical protein CFH82_03755 [Sulfurospirillum sp. UBA12182]